MVGSIPKSPAYIPKRWLLTLIIRHVKPLKNEIPLNHY